MSAISKKISNEVLEEILLMMDRKEDKHIIVNHLHNALLDAYFEGKAMGVCQAIKAYQESRNNYRIR